MRASVQILTAPHRRSRPGATLLVVACCVTVGLTAQTGDATSTDDVRLRQLQAEADRLARESRGLLSELRSLEIEREMRAQAARRAERELAQVAAARDATQERVARLEAERLSATPGINERLVTLYKRRRGGYARLLLDRSDMAAIGRLARGVAGLAAIDRARFDAHRRRLAAERDALAALETERMQLAAAEQKTRDARTALDRAIARHNQRIDAVDAERDLAARYAGELQTARDALDRRVADLPATAPVAPAVARGSLEWPVSGRVTAPFGRAVDARTGVSVARNGIDVGVPPDTPVRAVLDGTVVFAAPFTGFGALVILDHGDGVFSLYGYLAELTVVEGARAPVGATVGYSGRNPAGADALYFELRVDGRPVDPVQWLRSPR